MNIILQINVYTMETPITRVKLGKLAVNTNVFVTMPAQGCGLVNQGIFV